MSLYILTLAEMKAELGIDDTDDDAVLTEWMEGLQKRFDAYCERTLLYSASVTEYHDGGERWLLLDRYPVESISSIIIDQDREWDSEDALTEDEDYVLNADRGRIAYGTGEYLWTAGFQNIRVVYAGGYVACDGSPTGSQVAMPYDLRLAMRLQVGFLWRNRRNLGAQAVSGQGVTVNLAPVRLLPEVREILTLYRRV